MTVVTPLVVLDDSDEEVEYLYSVSRGDLDVTIPEFSAAPEHPFLLPTSPAQSVPAVQEVESTSEFPYPTSTIL